MRTLSSRSRSLTTAVGSMAAAVAVVGVTLGAGVAGAATISPANTTFTAPGTITVTTPASFNVPVTCNIVFSGSVNADGSAATITDAKVSGNCTINNLSVNPNPAFTLS